MILIYAFSNPWGTNISRRTLLELQKIISPPSCERGGQGEIVFHVINSYPQQFFKKHIQGGFLPALSREGSGKGLILGLGDGFSDKIKIETQAKNAYNNKSIYPFSSILLDLSLPNLDNFDPQYFSIGSNMGTSNCNWMAYSTQLYLDQKSLSTHHIFLNLPKKANAQFIASQIKTLFDSNNIYL